MSKAERVIPASPPRWDLDFDALAHDLRPLGNPARLRLLNYLTAPRYLEEIATFLKMNRFAAKKHMDQLVNAALVEKAPAQREQGLVVEYRVAPQKLFELFDGMRALGTLRPLSGADDPEAAARTKPAVAMGPRAATEDGPRLVVVYGIDLGKVHYWRASGPAVVGRDSQCGVRLLSDPFVSGRHARIERTRDAFAVTDLHSTNGTFVDLNRLGAGETRSLENGSLLGIGKTWLLFRLR